VQAPPPSGTGHQHFPVFESALSQPHGGSLDGGGILAKASRAGGSIDGDSASFASTSASTVTSSQLQSYTVVKEIGGGGAGKAYLVTGKADAQKYVAKQIVCLGDQYKPAPASYALQEARLLFMLKHPHICGLVDFYPKSANFFIVMEFCEQGDLGRHISSAIRRGNVNFDAERVYTWWYQMLDAVDFCHSKNILHRDLKPKNIFIDAKLNIKVFTEWCAPVCCQALGARRRGRSCRAPNLAVENPLPITSWLTGHQKFEFLACVGA